MNQMNQRNPPCGGYGDVDGDGVITPDDVQMAARHYYGLDLFPEGQLTSEQFKRADVDGDGAVTMTDAALIQSYIQGSINTFPVCSHAAKEIPTWLYIGAAIILFWLLINSRG